MAARPNMPRVWITYAWADVDEGDFSYLVQRLQDRGIEAEYDKIALVPGRRLWDQISDRIGDPATDGWASIVTPGSMESEACKEELAYALNRALATKDEFPLIGLLHGVPLDLHRRRFMPDCASTSQRATGLSRSGPVSNNARRIWSASLSRPFG